MWNDENDNIMKLYGILEEHDFYSPLPAICPICGTKSGHIYMHRYDEENHGGLWLWCSSCHCFAHLSCMVPDWWKNLSLFTILDLEAVPENLDKQSVYIDSFVNKLLAIKDDAELKNPRLTTPCEKCGENMIITLPEGLCGSYEIACPKCGWGVATSYFDPILRDDTEYQIFLLEGNRVTIDAIRAVSQVSHNNLLKSRKLIESAPHAIFKGKSLDVHEKKAILDEVSVLYKIEPDYPYD